MERLINSGTKEAKPDVTISEALKKLAEYEDFEEIFRSKMTDDACDFLKDKEEFAKWLDRNKWIAKKCDEYARAEEQGKLLKLPCSLGDMVYRIIKEFNTGMKKIISGKVYRIALTDAEMQIFIDKWQSKGIFGKTVFLTREEAEAALKEL